MGLVGDDCRKLGASATLYGCSLLGAWSTIYECTSTREESRSTAYARGEHVVFRLSRGLDPKARQLEDQAAGTVGF
jgi:hypothetical protein